MVESIDSEGAVLAKPRITLMAPMSNNARTYSATCLRHCLVAESRNISDLLPSILIAAQLSLPRDALVHQTAKPIRAEILAIEDQWATAIERQDAATFERIAAEDFRFYGGGRSSG